MLHFTFKNRILLLLVVLVGFTTACKKDDDAPAPTTSEPGYRTTKIDYSTLTPTTSYKATFTAANGDSTIDRTEGRNRLRMFRALATYISTSVANGTVIDETKLNNMFSNTGSPFEGVYADLNALTINIKEVTGSSSNQAQVHEDIEDAFERMAYISTKASQTAVKGTAGKSGTYLLDEAGVEWAQIIQKSLIGGLDLDYISNVLLNTGLNADNKSLVVGTNSTALEHNWDLAYGFLSLNDIYGSKEVQADPNATPNPIRASSGELYLGSYVWEYNKPGFLLLHGAFLKGRAAIHNNDMATVRAQAAIIRGILEKAIGGAAYGYMNKAIGAPHAFGEGLGFIYSTRFCTLTGADAAFSDGLVDDLFDTETTTFYDITAAQYTTVKNKLTAKFNL